MKHKYLLLPAAAVAAFVPGTALAQTSLAGSGSETESNVSRLELVKTSATPDVKDILKKDRPNSNQDIPVPHFALRTPDNNFIMTVGGQINTILGADLGNDLYQNQNAGGGFMPSQIYVPAQYGRRADTFINPLNANIDFQIVGLGGTEHQITGYIKFGTNGLSNNLLMKKAYLTWHGISAGMKNTLFQDNNACQPPTIDPQGPNGMISTTAYEVSYTSPSYGGFRYAVGLDIPSYYSSNGIYRGKDYKVWKGEEIAGQPVADPTAYNQNIPDIPMWIEYAASANNRIRLSGIVRNFSYRDLIDKEHRDVVGWGMMLSGNYSPVEPLIFYGTAAYGKGIGAYIQDIAGIPVSYVPSDSKPGEMSPTPMMGWMAGATYNINSQWQVNVMGSQARIWDVEPYATAASSTPDNLNNYKSGLYLCGNVFYNISSYLQVGMEYLYGKRTTWNAGSASDNRIQMQLLFTI